MRWLNSRSDSTEGLGQALERRVSLLPSCDGGGCDVAVTADGVDGTGYPEGYTPPTPGKPHQPYTLSWNAASRTYGAVHPPSLVSCGTADGKSIPDGYEVTSTTSLTFTAARGDIPAALHGTHLEKAKGVGAGVAAGCTDFESVWNVAAAPLQLSTTDRVDLSGTYRVTEVVELFVPSGTREPGFAGILLPSSTIEKTASGYTVAGMGPPVSLALAPSGWSGKAASSLTACDLGTTELADAYTQTERWSDLRPAVSTKDDGPIIVGRWLADWTPTASGSASGCPPTSNKGYVIFIPLASVPTGRP